MEKVEWKVEGMDCTNCALTITRFLQKEGQKEVKVNFIGGDVSFETNGNIPKELLAKGIEGLGYHVVSEKRETRNEKRTALFSNHLQRFLFCLPFTLILMLHMLTKIAHACNKNRNTYRQLDPWVHQKMNMPGKHVEHEYQGKRKAKEEALKVV